MSFCCGTGRDPLAAEMAADDSPVVDEAVCAVADVPPGTKKDFEVRGRKILIINDGGKFFAVNGVCSHYNAPLVDGIYSDGKIRCPWHGACFSVKTGDIEDYPAFDSLHAFQIRKVGDKLHVKTTEKRLASDRRTRKAAKYSLSSEKPIIVVGSGIAAQSVVENLRLAGCTSPISMITKEAHPPYDRVLLSKKPSASIDDIRMRKADYYCENNINIVVNTKIVGVDPVKKVVTLNDKSTFPYSKCVLALGGRVRRLPNKGGDLQGVHTLRTVSDANSIAVEAEGRDVVCIGASFIGMEVASAVRASAASVTVVCSTEEPLPAFGVDVGRAVRKYFETKDVHIVRRARVSQLHGDSAGRVAEVVLEGGQRLAAQCVVVGIGVDPDTAWVRNGTIRLDDRGFVKVDEKFETNEKEVFAIGDAVSAPLPFWGLPSLNIQHFQVAQRHGQLAAHAILGKPLPGRLIPYFWSLFFFEKGVKFAGCAEGYDETYVRGDVDGFDFVKYYLRSDTVVAVCQAGLKKTAIQFLALCDQGKRLSREDVEKNKQDDWQFLLK